MSPSGFERCARCLIEPRIVARFAPVRDDFAYHRGMHRRAIVVVFGLSAVVATAVVTTWGPERPSPNPPGTWSFAALGDAPYYPWEELQYRLVRQELDAN